MHKAHNKEENQWKYGAVRARESEKERERERKVL